MLDVQHPPSTSARYIKNAAGTDGSRGGSEAAFSLRRTTPAPPYLPLSSELMSDIYDIPESKHKEDETSVRFYLRALQPFLEEEGITEIAFNNPESLSIFVEKFGRWEERPFVIPEQRRSDNGCRDRAASLAAKALAGKLGTRNDAAENTRVSADRDAARRNYDHIAALARAVASWNHDEFSETKPILSATLPDGERAQFVMPPACMKGRISMTIRRPTYDVMTMSDYQAQGFFGKIIPVTSKREGDDELMGLYREMFDETSPADVRCVMREKFLTSCVRLGRTIVIAGGTGSGKTTFMKSLMQSIPNTDRIITIEDVPELIYGLPDHRNQVNLLYPSEATETSAVNATKLMKSCLRMKPDRILLAELRSGETYDWLNSVLSGHSGSITSCHANNCASVFDYLALKVLQSEIGRHLPYDEIKRLLRDVIDVIVHIHNNRGERHITEIYYKAAREAT